MNRFQMNMFFLCLFLATVSSFGISANACELDSSLPLQVFDGATLKGNFSVWKMGDEGNTIAVIFFEKSGIYHLHKDSENFVSNLGAIQDSRKLGGWVSVDIDLHTSEIQSAKLIPCK